MPEHGDRPSEDPGIEDRESRDREADLVALLDEASADDRSERRTRERWLRRQAEESARFAGTVLDLAERRAVVTVRTESGRSYHGTIAAVAADFLVLRAGAGADAYVALDAIVSLRPHTEEPPADGERPIPSDARLMDVLAEAAAERLRVSLVCRGGSDAIAGELRAAGVDVLTVRLDGARRVLCYVRASALCEVVVERRS